jgi:ubiquinone/menaquinone biosynthesis C-methylase UbiE
MSTSEPYVPALGYRWLTPFYDAVVGLTTRERAFKSALVDQAALKPGERVLDLACGTATLTLMAHGAQPNAEIHALDGDPEILKLARRKAERAGAAIRFDEGLSTRMPYAAESFDKVICSLFFHHLQRAAKLQSFREIARVLKPGGELHVADWGRAANPLMRAAFCGIQLLDGFPNTADNVDGLLPGFIRDSGLIEPAETRRYSTVFGTLSLYRAAKIG